MTSPSDLATILALSPDKQTTYRMPQWVFDLVESVLDYGQYHRNPRMTVPRAINLLEIVVPDIRDHIEVSEEEPPKPTVRGISPDTIIIDDIPLDPNQDSPSPSS